MGHSQELKGTDSGTRLALWCLREAYRNDFSFSELMNGLKILFGSAEAQRLTALALMDEDIEISLLFWLKSLLERLKEEGPVIHRIKAYLKTIGDLTDSLFMIDGNPDPDFLEGFTNLSNRLKGELTSLQTLLDDAEIETLRNMIADIQGKLVTGTVPENQRKSQNIVQLELF